MDAFLDALFDSLKILGLAFLFYFVFSFFEAKIARFLESKKRLGPLFGSLAGSLPQCGISVVGSDLYADGHISMGTLLAIYLATSDEALPVLFSDFSSNWYRAFLLIFIKMAYAFFIGFLLDSLYRGGVKKVNEHLEGCEEKENHEHTGCCGHEIEGEGAIHEHLLHPLFHSLKIFLYSLAITFLFNSLIFYAGGEEAFSSFLVSQYYLSPLYALLIGLIPSCASSVIISEAYLSGALPFGALLAGLSVNAGLGPLYLLKSKEKRKEGIAIIALLIISALLLGYAFMFIPLPF